MYILDMKQMIETISTPKNTDWYADKIEDLLDRLEQHKPELYDLWNSKYNSVYSGDNEPDIEELKAMHKSLVKILDPDKEEIQAFSVVSYESLDKAGVERCVASIERRMQDSHVEHNSLGKGTVAEVFQDPDVESMCYKIIYNFKKYNKWNNVKEEADFLDDLSEVNVRGVRAPIPICYVEDENNCAITMETIPGVSLEDILIRGAKVPENFDFEDFFDSLEEYIEAIHGMGIYHRDLNTGNIIIDERTLKPVVIDFGAARKIFIKDDDPYINTEDGRQIRYSRDETQIQILKKRFKKYII